jgi:hypothetical protein
MARGSLRADTECFIEGTVVDLGPSVAGRVAENVGGGIGSRCRRVGNAAIARGGGPCRTANERGPDDDN